MVNEETVNEKTVKAWIAAFHARDVESIVALYARDAILYDTGMPRPRHGREEIRHWFRVRFGTMPRTEYRPAALTVVDQTHMQVKWLFVGESPRFFGQRWLSHPFQVEGTSYLELSDGLICQQQGVYDHLSVLRQAIPPLRRAPAALLKLIYGLYLRRNRL